MANPFTSILETLGVLPPSEPNPWTTATMPEPGVAPPVSQGYPTGQTRPEPFGIMDVLGIGSHARAQQRLADENQRIFERGLGETRATNSAQNDIVQAAIKMRNENPDLPPHVLVNRVLQSPDLAKNFHRVPAEDMQKLVDGVIKATQQPPATTQKIGAGEVVEARDPTTGKIIPGQGTRNPTADVQKYDYLASRTPEQLANLRKGEDAILRPQPDNKSAALGRMLGRGEITQQQYDLALAHSIELKSVPTANGGIATQAIDMTNPQRPKVIWSSVGAGGPPSGVDPNTPPPSATNPTPVAPGAPAPSPRPDPSQPRTLPPGPAPAGPAPGAPPAGPSPGAVKEPPGQVTTPPRIPTPDEAPDARRTILNDGYGGASMWDAAGGLRGGVTAIGRFLGNAPELATFGEESSAKRDAIYAYKYALDTQLKEGRELKSDLATRAGLMPDMTGLDANPSSEINKAIRMRVSLEDLRTRTNAALYATNADGSPRLSTERRGKLFDKIEGIDSVLATLPSVDEMNRYNAEYKKGKLEDIFKKGLPPVGAVTGEASRLVGQGEAAAAGAVDAVAKPGAPAPAQPQGLPDATALQGMDDAKLGALYKSLGGANAPPDVKAIFWNEYQRRRPAGGK